MDDHGDRVGFTDLDPADAEAFLERIGPQEQLRHERLEAVLGPDGTNSVYLQVGDDDLTDKPPAR